MIDIKNITKSFGSLQVLKGIDLHIDKGEVVSLVPAVLVRLLSCKSSVLWIVRIPVRYKSTTPM